MTLVRLIARPMLSTMFITGGINALKNTDSMVQRAQPVTDKLAPVLDKATSSLPFSLSPKQMVQANAVVHIVAGSMLATGRAPRLSALALVVTLLPTTFGGHRYWEQTDPQQRANQRLHFLKNISLTGGLLLAAVDTEGKPSVAWLARRTAGNARRRITEQANALTPS